MTKKSKSFGIQSVEVAATVLSAFMEAGYPVPLKEVARRAGMHPGKIHRYLVSLTRAGLIEQDPQNGNYGIGPMAISLGLTGLRNADVVRYASDALPALRDEVDETAYLSMWGPTGPVIVRLEEASKPVFMNIRVGSIVPVLTSAAGRIFAAYLPAGQTRPLIAAERKSAGAGREKYAPSEVESLLAAVRQRRLARVTGDLVPGVNAIAAPIFDHKGRAAAAIGALGRSQDLDAAWQGKVAQSVSRVAAEISKRLGYTMNHE